MEEERKRCTQEIVNSTDRYKLIAAGAGTGKSFTMLKILESDPDKDYLVLTLTNELINDLEKHLGNHARCKTFHSFGLEIFKEDLKNESEVYPQLNEIIQKDADILELGHNIINSLREYNDESSRHVIEYLKRAEYYNAADFDSIIYTVAKYLQKNKDKVKEYNLVLIDEFQDFSKLETELVNILEEKNKMLIVGDDDQSIYGFRGAHPDFFRSKHTDKKYTKFTLPFCSRCTEVIVSTVNAIVQRACSEKIFTQRIQKEYKCYLPDKKNDSDSFPKIIHKNFSVQNERANYMGSFVEKFYDDINADAKKIAKEKKEHLVLIIGPHHYLDLIYKKLISNIPSEDIAYKRKEPLESRIISGLKLIDSNVNSNLGWRIIAEKRLTNKVLKKLIIESKDKNITELISDNIREETLKVIALLNRENISNEEQEIVSNFIGTGFSPIFKYWQRKKLSISEHEDHGLIKLTTFESSKGLSADYVFIVGLHQGILPKGAVPIESEICKFIVALTRTKKQCHILTCNYFGGKIDFIKSSSLIDWIPAESLSKEEIDAKKMNQIKNN